MSMYGNTVTLGGDSLWGINIKQKVGDMFESFISSMSKATDLKLTIPHMTYLRTELLCEYIGEKVGIEFGISDFIMVLYLDFINGAIKKYDPKKIYETISSSYGYNDTIKISCGDEIYEYNRSGYRKVSLVISMDKADAKKGEILLEEMLELYGVRVSLDDMICNLWIDFIEGYKRGDNQKAFNAIIKMLKQNKGQ